MRWPGAWTDPAMLDRVKAAGIDTLFVDNSDEFDAVRSRAAQMELKVAHPDDAPEGIRIVKGEWPGIRLSRGNADASAGPTGVPWVDSNGWAIRLSAALHPKSGVWIDAAPPQQTFPSSYLTAIADCGAYGGRWIVTLDDALAQGAAKGNDNAVRSWTAISQATSYFAAHRAWTALQPAATLAVVSDFQGGNEFFNQELLNLLARAGQHCLVLPKDRPLSLAGIRAAIYADTQPPAPAVRKALTDFVQAGGLLITTPVWGDSPTKQTAHPRYYGWTVGKGRIARAIDPPADPYEMAQDAVVLISHRHDLIRFWNAGAYGSSYVVSPDRKQAVAHLLFYSNRGPDQASVRIAGPYRKVNASTVDTPDLKIETVAQKDAVEVHLPQVSQYVALELTV
jgi:hypothetical protein